MPVHYPSSFNNTQYLGGGTIRLTSWRQAIVPQNTPPYGLNYYSANGVSSGVVKTTGGATYSFYVTSTNSSNARFLQFFNLATIPTSLLAPAFVFSIPPGTVNSPTEIIVGSDFFGPNGIAFTYGISFGLSTSLTAFYPTPTPTDHVIQINYT
jgi:hypothetical protein